MKQIGKDNERTAMDVLSDEQIELFEKVTETYGASLFISGIDYVDGLIYIGVHYNKGTENAFDNEQYLKINVAGESVACMLWELTNVLVKHL